MFVNKDLAEPYFLSKQIGQAFCRDKTYFYERQALNPFGEDYIWKVIRRKRGGKCAGGQFIPVILIKAV